MLVETLRLSGAGAAAGLAVGYWGSRALHVMLSSSWRPVAIETAPDVRVLLFCAALALATGIACGLAPALRATGAPIYAGLPRGGAFGISRRHLGRLLVVAQIALPWLCW